MKERKFLIRHVKKARDLIEGKLKITPKDKTGDLVTNFDTKIEKYLIKKIKRTYPNFDIISEEFNSDKKITKNCFIIDPIDGTNNFARKIPIWGIQLACIKDGKTVASVIYLPIYEELYSADESGAYLNDEKIYVNKQTEKVGVYSVSTSVQSAPELFKKNPNNRKFGSSAFSFAMVACGKTSAVYMNKNSHPWDVIPGEFLVKQAGGVIFDVNGVRVTANSKSWGDLLAEAPTPKVIEKTAPSVSVMQARTKLPIKTQPTQKPPILDKPQLSPAKNSALNKARTKLPIKIKSEPPRRPINTSEFTYNETEMIMETYAEKSKILNQNHKQKPIRPSLTEARKKKIIM